MLIQKGVLKNPRLVEAFRKVDRVWFVRKDEEDLAYVDEPLPIGEGQTISQPWTVAFMLELLDPKPGDNVMEIGYGSGWVTALLAVVGANVYAIERISKLCKFGKENVERFFAARIENIGNQKLVDENSSLESRVQFFCQDGTLGLPEVAKKINGFDKLIVAAAVSAAPTDSVGAAIDLLPRAWRNQLKTGGKIVVPIGHGIFEFTKKTDDRFGATEHSGFAFVPLISDNKINESRP